MTPSRLSSVLRSFADKIDRSSRPSRSSVASELRRVLAAMGQKTICLDASGTIGYSDSNPVDDDENDDGQKVVDALEHAGASDVEWTDEGVNVTFPEALEERVRKAIDAVKSGLAGPAFAAYFSVMKETNEDGNEASGPTGSGSGQDWTFEVVQDEDSEGSAPTFLVKGTDDGQPFECKLGIELDDRNFDFEHVSGADFSDDPDKQAELLEALYGSRAYREALVAFEASDED